MGGFHKCFCDRDKSGKPCIPCRVRARPKPAASQTGKGPAARAPVISVWVPKKVKKTIKQVWPLRRTASKTGKGKK